MSAGSNKTADLLEQLITSKKNLADTLVSKGEEADFNEPFSDLVQKAADYIPKTYIFVDENGNETVGTLVAQETVFDADVNDVREGKVFASELGVKVGEKVIPTYHTSEGYVVIMPGSVFAITKLKNRYDFSKLQALMCPFSSSISQSVATDKVAINEGVYEVNSTKLLATVQKDSEKQHINFMITNGSDTPYILRYFTYKEIY